MATESANVPPPECFICTDSVPMPRRSSCLCTDRYVHDACLVKMLESTKRAACPVCAARYTNVASRVVVVGVEPRSRGALVIGAAIVSIILIGCAINTWLAFCCGRKLSSQEDFVVCFASILMTSVGFAAVAFVGRECVMDGPRKLARSILAHKRMLCVTKEHVNVAFPSEVAPTMPSSPNL